MKSNSKSLFKLDEKKSDSSISPSSSFFNSLDVSACGDIVLKDRVRILLLRKKLSQNQLADKIQINKGTLSKILNGHWAPTTYVKLKMSEVLDCDSLVLFGNKQYWADYERTYKDLKESSK